MLWTGFRVRIFARAAYWNKHWVGRRGSLEGGESAPYSDSFTPSMSADSTPICDLVGGHRPRLRFISYALD
jgi:hypothetical protein